MQLKTALLSTAVVAALAGLAGYATRVDTVGVASTAAAGAATAAPAAAAAGPQDPRVAAALRHQAALRAMIDTSARPGSLLAWASTSQDEGDRSAAAERARGLLAGAGAREANVAKADGFNAREVLIDRDGTEHVRMDRSYQGLPVIGGDMVVHSRAGELLSITQGSNMRTGARPDLKPGINADQARIEAGAHFDGRVAETSPARLVVYARNGMQPTLAYEVALNGERRDDPTPGVFSYYLDARNGALLEAEDAVQAAEAVGSARTVNLGTVSITTNSSGKSYVLTDPTRGNNQTRDAKNGGNTKTGAAPSDSAAFTDADNAWGDGTNADRATAAGDVHYSVAATWDFFKSVYGRKGLKNDGKGITSYVHYGTDYLNASYIASTLAGGGYMIYGDGGEKNNYRPMVALDMAAHEMAHGVNNATAKLGYYGVKDSGGINESSSDIFGMLVEYSVDNPNDPGDWMFAEKLFDGTNPKKAVRLMFDQAADGRSFSCYPADGFTAADSNTVEVDGVKKSGKHDPHFTSGIGNHFAYLLSQGTTPPDNFPEYTPDKLVCNGDTGIVGIGRAKLGKIWYDALTKYMVSSTDYPGARAATLSAAKDAYGADSDEYKAVARAWSAVNVN